MTVAGTAGIGKTRLAQAVAHQLRSRYPDGVWIVEFAPVADGALNLALYGGVTLLVGASLWNAWPQRGASIMSRVRG